MRNGRLPAVSTLNGAALRAEGGVVKAALERGGFGSDEEDSPPRLAAMSSRTCERLDGGQGEVARSPAPFTEKHECLTMALTHPRLLREHRTLAAMVEIYCRDQHGRRDGLCPECQSLVDYAAVRLERCVFQPDKPTCAQCPVHCHRASYRDQAKLIMRYAGPRMLWRHPILAARHAWDARRPARPLNLKRADQPPMNVDEYDSGVRGVTPER